MVKKRTCAVLVRMARCDDPADMDAQERMLLDVADGHGLEVSAIHREIGPAYADDLESRPVLRSLLDEVRAGRYDAVVVRDFSRFARGSMAVQGAVMDALRRSGTSVVTMDREYLMSDDHDVLALEMFAFTTAHERAAIGKDRTTRPKPSRR